MTFPLCDSTINPPISYAGVDNCRIYYLRVLRCSKGLPVLRNSPVTNYVFRGLGLDTTHHQWCTCRFMPKRNYVIFIIFIIITPAPTLKNVLYVILEYIFRTLDPCATNW